MTANELRDIVLVFEGHDRVRQESYSIEQLKEARAFVERYQHSPARVKIDERLKQLEEPIRWAGKRTDRRIAVLTAVLGAVLGVALTYWFLR